MRPRVILHNAVSLDGRVTGFFVDLGIYYRLASHWGEDVTLAGCDTLLAPGLAQV
jgi:2,5-diamino-6-(ribosylamino)-4(3H)-pyrimidinone 5'-phosphate reductase